MTKPLTPEQIAEAQRVQTEKAEREAAGLPPIVPAVEDTARPVEKAEGRRPYTINLRPADHLAARSWALRHKTTFSGLVSGLLKAHILKATRGGEVLNEVESAILTDKEKEHLKTMESNEEIDKI